MAVDLKVFLAGTLGAAVLVLLDTLTEFSGGLHFYPELIAIGILGLGSFCRDLVYFAVGREPVQDLSKQRIIPNVAFCIMAVLILALTLTWYVNLRLELRAPEVWFNPTMHCVKRTLLLLWAPIPFKALRQGVRNVVRAFKEGSKW